MRRRCSERLFRVLGAAAAQARFLISVRVRGTDNVVTRPASYVCSKMLRYAGNEEARTSYVMTASLNVKWLAASAVRFDTGPTLLQYVLADTVHGGADARCSPALRRAMSYSRPT